MTKNCCLPSKHAKQKFFNQNFGKYRSLSAYQNDKRNNPLYLACLGNLLKQPIQLLVESSPISLEIASTQGRLSFHAALHSGQTQGYLLYSMGIQMLHITKIAELLFQLNTNIK
jgi:hypothetical protein